MSFSGRHNTAREVIAIPPQPEAASPCTQVTFLEAQLKSVRAGLSRQDTVKVGDPLVPPCGLRATAAYEDRSQGQHPGTTSRDNIQGQHPGT